MAAPIASQVLTDVLQYLEIKKDNEIDEDIIQEVEVPEVRGETIKEAKKKLKEIGLELTINVETGENNSELIIKEQFPKPGIKIKVGSKIEVKI